MTQENDNSQPTPDDAPSLEARQTISGDLLLNEPDTGGWLAIDPSAAMEVRQ